MPFERFFFAWLGLQLDAAQCKICIVLLAIETCVVSRSRFSGMHLIFMHVHTHGHGHTSVGGDGCLSALAIDRDSDRMGAGAA